MRRERSAARGFGLLEAIVAMAILGSAGLLLFGWLQSSLETASRLRDAEARARLQIEAQGYVARLNPMRQPSGEQRLADIELRWQSHPLEAPRPEANYGEMIMPVWWLALYEVEVEAVQGPIRSRWTQRVAGWSRQGPGAAP